MLTHFAYRARLLFFAAIMPALLTAPVYAEPNAVLADYVSAGDPSFAWHERQHRMLLGHEIVELIVTSQTWRDIPWRHQLFIIKPAVMRHPNRMVLIVAGSRWRDQLLEPPAADESLPSSAAAFALAAQQIGSPVAVLMQVPFQPMFNGRTEDAIIAYTFDKYLDGGDDDWPLLLPMVKSTVRAMDVLEQYAREHWELEIDGFTVSGGSKRGWTTWLTAAVDPRVHAIAPMVIDMLNLSVQMRHQVETFGGYSEKIHDYTDLKIQERMDTERGAALRRIVDPYAYRERLTMPKLIVLGTNDPFWPVDALRHYWSDLHGPKFISYVPNAGHDLGGDMRRIFGGLTAIHHAACGELTLPKLQWEFDESDNTLRLMVRSDQPPAQVQAWTAASPTRDFRPARWSAQPMPVDGQTYRYQLPAPAEGYRALFATLSYDHAGVRYDLATTLKVFGASVESLP